jgi:hypothetical protein
VAFATLFLGDAATNLFTLAAGAPDQSYFLPKGSIMVHPIQIITEIFDNL